MNQNSTIFKTINGDLTLFNKTLIATKDNLRSLETVNATVYNKHGVFNLEGLTTSATKSVSSFTKLGNAFKAYNGNLSKSTQLQTAYIKAVGSQNSALGNYLAGLNGAKASMGGYIKSLVAAKAASIGLQVASIALNTAITMGVSLAISALVSQISKWIHAQEEARQKSVELTNSYKEQQSSLDSQIEKYKELKETLDKGNLSTDESRSIKEQLLGIQQSLIESYGDEASNIDLVNGKYREQLGLLSELSKEKATDYVTENRDIFADAKEALEKIRTYNLGTVTSWNTYAPETEDQKRLIEYLETYSDLLDLTYSGTSSRGVTATSVSLSVKADVENADEIMHQLAEDLEKYGKDNNIDVSGLLEGISGQLKKTWTDELTEYKTVYDEFMKAEIVRNDTLRPLYQESIKAVEDYNNALSTGEGVEEAKANLDSVQQSVQNATSELEGSQDVFDGIYDGINKDAEAAYNLGQAFENDKKVQEYAEQLRGLSDIDLKAINFEDTVEQPGEKAFTSLMTYLGYTKEEVQKLIDKLVELGYVQGEVQDSNPDKTDNLFSYDKLSDIPQKLAEVENAYKTAQEALDSYNEKGYYSMDVIDSILSLEDEYINVLVDQNGQLQINESSMNQLAKIKIEAAKASIYQETCEELVRIKTLDTSLAAQELALVNGTLTESAYETAKALYEEVVAMGGANAALANNVWDSATKKVKLLDDQLKSLNNGSYDVGKSAIADSVSSATKDAEKATKEYIDSYMDYMEKSLESGRIDYQTYSRDVSKFLKDMYDQSKIAAKDYHDYTKEMLEVQKSIYDKVINAVVRRYDTEIDKINEVIDGIEKQNDALQKQLDNYDGILSVVDSVYEKQIQTLEDEKDLLQDKINALNDEADAYDLIRRKEDALYALRRAESQRTKKVFNGTEFVYETDQDAIRDAQQTLQDIETEELINNLEKEQDVLDDEIEKLQEFKEKWQEITEAYDTEIEQQLAISRWGQEYESVILQNRIEDIESFKNDYVSIQEQIDDNQSMIDSYNEKIEYYEGLKEQWNAIADTYENSVNDQLAAQILGANWEADILNGRIGTLDNFKNQYMSIQQAIADAAWASANEQIRAAKEAQKGASGTTGNNKKWYIYDAKTGRKLSGAYNTQAEATKDLNKYAALTSSHQVTIKKVTIKKYASGTKNAKPGLHIISENEYGDEIIIDNDDNAVLAKGEQLYPFVGGETVIKASEADKILNNTGNLVPIDTLSFTGINGEKLSFSQSELLERMQSIMPNYTSMIQPNIQMPKYDYVPVSRDNSVSVSIGDIYLHEVQNVDKLGNEIIKRLPNVMMQAINKL